MLVSANVGSGDEYLVVFHDVNCPFCSELFLAYLEHALATGKPFKLIYYPVHYYIWRDVDKALGYGSYLANISQLCVQDGPDRVKYIMELDKLTKSLPEPAAIKAQLERAAAMGFPGCLGQQSDELKDPDATRDSAVEFANSIGIAVTGVPHVAVVKGDRAVKQANGLYNSAKLIREYFGSPYASVDLVEAVKNALDAAKKYSLSPPQY